MEYIAAALFTIAAALFTIAVGVLFMAWDKNKAASYRAELIQCNKEKTNLYNQVCKQKRQIQYLINESSNVTSKSKKVQSENYRLKLSNTDCKKNLTEIRNLHKGMLKRINISINQEQ